MIEIEHSGDGTVVWGTSRGDAATQALEAHGFRFSQRLGGWYLPRTWQYATRDWRVKQLIAALDADEISYELSGQRERSTTAAERAEQTRARAEERAERLESKADRLANESAARYQAYRATADLIPPGQPVIPDHHSYRSDINRRERMHRNLDKAAELGRGSDDAARRADAARRTAEGATDPGKVQRKIASLEAELRSIERRLNGHEEEADVTTTDLDASEGSQPHLLLIRAEELADELAYQRETLDALVASGAKIWTKADFQVGDLVHVDGGWYPVVKVNTKTLAVKTPYLPWPLKTSFDKVSGQRSAQQQENIGGIEL